MKYNEKGQNEIKAHGAAIVILLMAMVLSQFYLIQVKL